MKTDTRNESNDARKKNKQIKWLHLLSCGLILLINAHAPSKVLVCSIRVSVFVWPVVSDSKTLRADENFFLENGENNSFSKENGWVWTGP